MRKTYLALLIPVLIGVTFLLLPSQNKELALDLPFDYTEVQFEERNYHVLNFADNNLNTIDFFFQDKSGENYGSIRSLNDALEEKGETLLFATNGGIFSEDSEPLGLYIEDGELINDVNLNQGNGNFFFMPNGVFQITENEARVIQTSDYEYSENIKHAVQSGPMLVIDGEINSAFTSDSPYIFTRSGVGLNRSGELFFVLSEQATNFFTFARFLRDELDLETALYLDGAISEIYVHGVTAFGFQDFASIIGVSQASN